MNYLYISQVALRIDDELVNTFKMTLLVNTLFTLVNIYFTKYF